MFLRPCFLVIDTEHGGSISTRKLVLETAKYNVITAYSCEEAVVQLDHFPRVHAVVMNANAPSAPCEHFVKTLRRDYPDVKLLVVGEHGNLADLADRKVPSFMPAELLAMMREMFPEQEHVLREREAELLSRDL